MAASPSTQPIPSNVATVANELSAMVRITGKEAKDKTLLVSSLINNDRLITHSVGDELRVSDSLVYSLPANLGGGSLVIIPIAGHYTIISNLSVYFTPSGDLSLYSETFVDRSVSDTFQIKQYENGQLVRSEVSDITYRSNDELKTELREHLAQQPMPVGDPTACATMAFGVGTVFGALLAFACAGACVSVVGAGACVACISAYAAVSYQSINTFMNCLKS